MKEFNVTWEIDVTAESPRDAARQAFLIQRDPGFTLATVFLVGCENGDRVTVDLSEPEVKS